MNSISYVIGSFIFILVVLAVMTIGTPLPIFIDIPSFLIVVGLGFALTLMSFSLKDIGAAVGHAFGTEGSIDELERSAFFWEVTSRNLIVGSILGTMIGMVKMLALLTDPSDVGPALGLSLLTLLYGILFSAMFPLPAMLWIRKRIVK